METFRLAVALFVIALVAACQSKEPSDEGSGQREGFAAKIRAQDDTGGDTSTITGTATSTAAAIGGGAGSGTTTAAGGAGGSNPAAIQTATGTATTTSTSVQPAPATPFGGNVNYVVADSQPIFAQPSNAGQAASVSGGNSGLQWLSGQTQPVVLNGTARLVSHYEPSQKLRLAFALNLPHEEEENQFLEDLQDKTSPLFHQFLSAEEWDARFGPTPEAEQAIVDWAESQGLTITNRYADRLIVDVEAPAGVIEKALQVTINNYLLPATARDAARTVFANDRDPVLPASIRSFMHSIHGLNSISVHRPGGGSGQLTPHPNYVAGPVAQDLGSAAGDAAPHAAPQSAAQVGALPGVSAPASGGWDPADYFASYAYDYQALMNQGHCCNPLNNPGHSPKESSIAIAAYGDVRLSDIKGFQSAFPYLAYNVHLIHIDGGYTCQDTAKTGDSECTEATMDAEWAIATSNGEGAASSTAKVYVYEGSGAYPWVILDVLNQMVTDDYARIMSTSWGAEEQSDYITTSQMEALHHVYSKMAGQGWTLVALSGDEGATAGCGDQLAVQYPASDPLVVGVGGTQLNEGDQDSSTYEIAWTGSTDANSCSTDSGGSGGGFSSYFRAPSYQKPLGFTMRAVPDIALDAVNSHDVYYHGSWIYEGGTSVSTPMMAGFFAQENAYLLAIGNKCGANGSSACAPLGTANYAIYSEGLLQNAGRSPFYDIVSGCNYNDITLADDLLFYCAGTGYDEVTGWGSANMLQLAWAINFYQATANGVPYVSFTGPAVNKWYNTNQTVSWKIVDYVGGDGGSPTGIAGFTQGWDSIPYDPSGEAHGGTGNSFYSGPQYVNVSTGCLAFDANGCAGGVSEGCHTVLVEGWNNMGLSTGENSYGPICYDTTPPVTAAILAGTLAGNVYTSPVSVIFTATDNASGVQTTWYSIDGGPNTVYSGGYFTVSSAGSHTITYYSVDVAGNRETPKSVSFTIQPQTQTQPPTAAPVFGEPSGNYHDPFSLTITDATPNAVIYFTTDGTTPTTSSTPYAGAFSLNCTGAFIQTCTVEAIAVAPGDSPSPIAVAVYTLAGTIK
jgi:hypothetical protein